MKNQHLSSQKSILQTFVLSEAEDITSGTLNRGGTAALPLLRTQVAIRQKLLEASFWEVIDIFVLLALLA